MPIQKIPKTIHYCWFGKKPLPALAIKCIESWKKHLPDYHIKEWNEDNFDIHSIPFMADAYKNNKYAFVSDVARFKILYDEGGIYFDTDVEIINDIEDSILQEPFMGIENKISSDNKNTEIRVAPGLGMASQKGNLFYKEMIDFYKNLKFCNDSKWLKDNTVVNITSKKLLEYGLKATSEIQTVNGIKIYPYKYFNPKSQVDGSITIYPETLTIHHFAGSWTTPFEKFKKKIQAMIGPTATNYMIRVKGFIVGRR